MPQTQPPLSGTETPSKASFWYDPKVRAVLYQIGALALVGMLAYYLMSNTMANLERQAIATGFEFFDKQASFEIGESLISYSAALSRCEAATAIIASSAWLILGPESQIGLQSTSFHLLSLFVDLAFDVSTLALA